jgi:hypothetical protein
MESKSFIDTSMIDSLSAIEGITMLHFAAKLPSDDMTKLNDLANVYPSWNKTLRYSSFRSNWKLIGKPSTIKDLVRVFQENNIGLVIGKCFMISSLISYDANKLLEKLDNLILNPPEQFRKFTLSKSDGEYCHILRIYARGASTLLFPSGRAIFSTGKDTDHLTFRDCVMRALNSL